MVAWPITITEAASRLDVPFVVASVLLRTHEIPVGGSATYKTIDEGAFDQLKVKAKPFARKRKSRRKRSACTA